MIRRAAVAAFLMLSWSLVTAVAGSNTVPGTRADHDLLSIGPNSVKPSACAGITVTTVIIGSGTINGTAASELILGGSGGDTIDAAGGDDCILGGGGNDTITGGAGTDVCIGGPGIDTFGVLGLGSGCETQIQ